MKQADLKWCWWSGLVPDAPWCAWCTAYSIRNAHLRRWWWWDSYPATTQFSWLYILVRSRTRKRHFPDIKRHRQLFLHRWSIYRSSWTCQSCLHGYYSVHGTQYRQMAYVCVYYRRDSHMDPDRSGLLVSGLWALKSNRSWKQSGWAHELRFHVIMTFHGKQRRKFSWGEVTQSMILGGSLGFCDATNWICLKHPFVDAYQVVCLFALKHIAWA